MYTHANNEDYFAMKELTATVTQRSQVTIPAEIRRLLGIKAHDRVIFSIEDNQVILQPAPRSLQSLAGSLTPLNSGLDPDERIREAKEDKIAREREERRTR
jgi:AbrB family looped-hinge helix DNA binding protein